MSSRAIGALVVTCVSAWVLVHAAEGAPDPAAILVRADAPHDAFPEGAISLRVTIAERGKAPVESLLELFVEGTQKSLAVFREGKQKGRRILTVGERVWLIVPGAARPVPVSKTQRLMGAASFGDIAQLRFAEEFVATLRPADDAVATDRGDLPCRVLDLVARKKGAAYPRGVLWVGRDDGLPRKLRLALASGKEAKEVRFIAYFDDLRIKTMEIRDLLVGGGDNTTALAFERYSRRVLEPAMFEPEGARAVP